MEVSLQLKTEAGADSAALFLCHNSLDKDVVRQIADALELETGTAFFLDVFAIPTGAEFLTWIERALAEASGCAVFLGANGWGPTHLWEAEKALKRYRDDNEFRLIPVALPGIKAEDMRLLGAGKVFQEINWADFSGRIDDPNAMAKLLAALSGGELPQHIGPARLTPYQVRRDAERWRSAKTRKEKVSILYRGAQLAAAERLVSENPDYLVLDKVVPFLTAAQDRDRSVLRRVAVGATTVTLAFLAIAVAAYIGYRLAEDRRLESASRSLAVAARDASGPDRQLLIAIEAFRRAPTAEAKGAVLELLHRWRPLLGEQQTGASIMALAPSTDGMSAVAGTEDGRLIASLSSGSVEVLSGPGLPATAVALLGDSVFIGRWDGSVDELRPDGTLRNVLPSPGDPANSERWVKALATTEPKRLIAAGSGTGQLRVLRSDTSKIVKAVPFLDEIRVSALAFDPSGRWLAVGTGANNVHLIETASWRTKEIIPRIDGGVLALGFADETQLVTISGYGLMTLHSVRDTEITRVGSHEFAGLFTSATMDAASGLVALGDAEGYVQIADLNGFDVGFGRLRGHAATVDALSFAAHGTRLVSGSSDGSLAIWDLEGGEGLDSALPSLPLEPVALGQHGEGELIALTNTIGASSAWRLEGGAWKAVRDLLASTRQALGPGSLERPEPVMDVNGFVELPGPEVQALAVSDNSVAWALPDGTVLWQALEPDAAVPVVLAARDGQVPNSIAISGNGRVVAVVTEGSRQLRIFRPADAEDLPDLVAPADVRSLALDATGDWLAAGLETGAVALFETAGQTPATVATIHQAAIAGLAFTGDGRFLLSYGSGGGGRDRSVAATSLPRLTETTQLVSRLPGGSATSLASDGEIDVVTVSDQNGQVQIWSLTDLRFVASLPVSGSYLAGVHVDGLGERVIGVDGNGQIRAWSLDPEIWLALVCRKAGRALTIQEWRELLPDDPYRPACATDLEQAE